MVTHNPAKFLAVYLSPSRHSITALPSLQFLYSSFKTHRFTKISPTIFLNQKLRELDSGAFMGQSNKILAVKSVSGNAYGHSINMTCSGTSLVGGSVLKNPPSNAGEVDPIPGQGEIPHAVEQ